MAGCAPDYFTSRFIKRANINNRTTRSSQQLNIPLFKNLSGHRTFYYRTVTVRNSLEPSLKLSKFISIFKKALSSKLLSEILYLECEA